VIPAVNPPKVIGDCAAVADNPPGRLVTVYDEINAPPLPVVNGGKNATSTAAAVSSLSAAVCDESVSAFVRMKKIEN
jgi:hypothetical protein